MLSSEDISRGLSYAALLLIDGDEKKSFDLEVLCILMSYCFIGEALDLDDFYLVYKLI